MQKKIFPSAARITVCLFFVGMFILPAFFSPLSVASAEQKCTGGADEGCFGLHEAAEEAGFKKIDDTTQDPAVLIGVVIQYVLGFVGVIFMILVIYGGFMWMFARGNEEKITKARSLIIHASIGLLIVLSAYVITRVITDQIITLVNTAE